MAKLFVVFSFLFAPALAFGQSLASPVIRYQSAAPCDFWSYQSGTGSSGYVCSGYPMRMSIAEANSVQSAIEQLHNRIRELELKVKELEQNN